MVRSDRGGQATYHGIGQAVVYTLVDLRRRGLGVRRFVELLEEAVIGLLDGHGVAADQWHGAPGVYVGGRKIASLGLRVSRGYCYHGVALNVNMDLRPFERIIACGAAEIPATRMSDWIKPCDASLCVGDVGLALARGIVKRLPALQLSPGVAADLKSQV